MKTKNPSIFEHPVSIDDMVHDPKGESLRQKLLYQTIKSDGIDQMARGIGYVDEKRHQWLQELNAIDIHKIISGAYVPDMPVPLYGTAVVFFNEIRCLKKMQGDRNLISCQTDLSVQMPDEEKPLIFHGSECMGMSHAVMHAFNRLVTTTDISRKGLTDDAIFSSDDVAERVRALYDLIDLMEHCNDLQDRMVFIMAKSVKFMPDIQFRAMCRLLKKISMHQWTPDGMSRSLDFMKQNCFHKAILNDVAEKNLVNLLDNEIPKDAKAVRDYIETMIREIHEHIDPVKDIITAAKSNNASQWIIAACVAMDYMLFLSNSGFDTPDFTIYQTEKASSELIWPE